MLSSKKIFLICIFFWVFASHAFARPMIIDTDVGVDDVIAMLYLLHQNQVEVKSITVESDGNAHALPAWRNTLAILVLENKKQIPVGVGSTHPLSGHHHFTQAVYDASDTLAGTAKFLPIIHSKQQMNAVNLLAQTLQQSPTPVDILAIGPLTNIAQLLQKYPAVKNKIHQIYFMGGSIKVPGNILAVDPKANNVLAEWNVYLDPLAADQVFRSGIPIVLVPLDVTNQVPLNQEFLQEAKKIHPTPTGIYLKKLLQEKFSHQIDWYFWDPLAAVIAINETLCDFETMRLKVVLSPEEQSGSLKITQNGYPVRVCMKINKKAFQQQLLQNFLKYPPL